MVTTLALVAFVLGAIGFGESVSESMYRSLQLFVLEYNQPSPAIPLKLEVARWLAPAVAGYAAVRAAILLFREQLQVVSLRLLARRHVVVAGLGAKGLTIAIALHESGRRVVALERDERNPAVVRCRQRDIPVLIGDASDRVLLGRALVGRATHLVVATGDDRRNVEIAFVAGRVLPAHRTSLTALVHLDDLSLWRLFQAEAIAKRARLPFRLDFFNVREAAARLMLDAYRPFAPTSGQQPPFPHLLVVGVGGLGESVLLRAAGMWQASSHDAGELLTMTMAGVNATVAITGLQARERAIGRICSLAAIDVAPASIAALLAPDGSLADTKLPVTAVYVCLDSDIEGLAVALALHAHPGLADVPIVVATGDERSGIVQAIHGEEGGRVRPFAVLRRTLTADLLDQSMNEALARAKHEHYVECELARGRSVVDNPSMVAWTELSESLKESNRRFADSAGAKLEAAGCQLIPAPLVDVMAPGFAFTETEIESLARGEHDRWCHDLELEGWRRGTTKDSHAKLHPKLVPWEDLTEEDRDKDREPVRMLPQMLARAGFEIQRGGADRSAARILDRAAAAAGADD